MFRLSYSLLFRLLVVLQFHLIRIDQPLQRIASRGNYKRVSLNLQLRCSPSLFSYKTCSRRNIMEARCLDYQWHPLYRDRRERAGQAFCKQRFLFLLVSRCRRGTFATHCE